jgi:hypothetical protein
VISHVAATHVFAQPQGYAGPAFLSIAPGNASNPALLTVTVSPADKSIEQWSAVVYVSVDQQLPTASIPV